MCFEIIISLMACYFSLESLLVLTKRLVSSEHLYRFKICFRVVTFRDHWLHSDRKSDLHYKAGENQFHTGTSGGEVLKGRLRTSLSGDLVPRMA